MFNLQNGRRAKSLAGVVACQIIAAFALAGCGDGAASISGGSAADAGASQGGGLFAGFGRPSKEFLGQCMRVQMADGSLRDSSVGLVQVGEFVGVMEGNPNAKVTWEKDGDGTYIAHDVIQDRVRGTEMTVDLKFADFGDAVASDVCGPRQVAATRVILNGIELKGYDKVAFIDKLMIKARP